MRNGLPILLELSERTIVIVGGGTVAARQAQSLLSSGARRVIVVASQFHESVPEQARRVQDAYHPRHLEGADLVIAAADAGEVNTRVVHDAKKQRILVARADAEPENEHRGDFVTMAGHREGPVTIAVGAGSPALSAMIRDGIVARLDPRWVRMAEAMRALRPRFCDELHLSPARRRALLRDLASEDALTAATAGPEEVWRWLVGKHPDLGRH